MKIKRKAYEQLLLLKKRVDGKKAILIEGARRIGKTFLIKEFAINEYRSNIYLDFSNMEKEVFNLFEEHLGDINHFLNILQVITGIRLYPRESVIIFDEIQLYPKARQAIKHLVADGRYDYIELGSLISIKENIKNILIPSEEVHFKMYPLDFEEFLIAAGYESLIPILKNSYDNLIPLGKTLHSKLLKLFKEYMLVGGMPSVISIFLDNDHDFIKAEVEKQDILTLYLDDIMKADSKYMLIVRQFYQRIISYLSSSSRRIKKTSVSKNIKNVDLAIQFLENSMLINECHKLTDPNKMLALNSDYLESKLYYFDTGLLITKFQEEKIEIRKEIYLQILNGNFSSNFGIIYENMIAQTLISNNHNLYYYSRYNNISHRNDIEIDFILESDKGIIPIEVKSGKRYYFNSLIKISDLYKSRIEKKIIIHPNDISIKGDQTIALPVYLAFLL